MCKKMNTDNSTITGQIRATSATIVNSHVVGFFSDNKHLHLSNLSVSYPIEHEIKSEDVKVINSEIKRDIYCIDLYLSNSTINGDVFCHKLIMDKSVITSKINCAN